jgi:hypothetical protein
MAAILKSVDKAVLDTVCNYKPFAEFIAKYAKDEEIKSLICKAP